LKNIGLIGTENDGNDEYIHCIIERKTLFGEIFTGQYTVEYYYLHYSATNNNIYKLLKKIEYHDVHYFRYEIPDEKWEYAGDSTDDLLWGRIFQYNLEFKRFDDILNNFFKVNSSELVIPRYSTMFPQLFDETKFEINTDSNELFDCIWNNLDSYYRGIFSSSGIYTIHYIKFENDNKFKFTEEYYPKRTNNIIEWEGIYKFDELNKLLFLRINNVDYVFEVMLYNYKEKGVNEQKILELYLYKDAKWNTPNTHIMMMDKRLSKVFYR
jgi:hypothetical protein